MTQMLPQPYPLWCAELHHDGSVGVGRVIAWELNGQVPQIVWEDPDSGRLLNGVSGPTPGNPLFLGSNENAAIFAAQRFVKPACDVHPGPLVQLDVGEWACRHATCTYRYTEGPSQPAIPPSQCATDTRI